MSTRFESPTMRARPHSYLEGDKSPSSQGPPSRKPSSCSPTPTPKPAIFSLSVPALVTEHAERPIIDKDAFEQLVDLDDDDAEHSFSRGMVKDYLVQATVTFQEMDESFNQKDLRELHRLSHFLKGSSAALGIARVQDICEKIQHLGNCTDPDLDDDSILPDDALSKIKPLLTRANEEYAEAKKALEEYLVQNPRSFLLGIISA